jgi:hypothetical protein
MQVNLEPEGRLTAEQAIPALPVIAFPPLSRPEIRNLHAIPFLSAYSGRGQINMLPSRWDPGVLPGILFVYERPLSELIQNGPAVLFQGIDNDHISSKQGETKPPNPCFSFLWCDEDDFQHIIDYNRVVLGPGVPTRFTGPPPSSISHEAGDDNE